MLKQQIDLRVALIRFLQGFTFTKEEAEQFLFFIKGQIELRIK